MERIFMRETFFRHYIRDIVYASNDGLVTTFAVVADGLSMGVGNYLGITEPRLDL
jgi:hypothetical protein